MTLESRLGRTPTNDEVSLELQISVQDLNKNNSKVSCSTLASIDELGEVEDLAPLSSDLMEDEQTRAELMYAVRDLAERQPAAHPDRRGVAREAHHGAGCVVAHRHDFAAA